MPSTNINTRKSTGRGLFRNALDRMMEARMREARHRARVQLVSHGYDADQILGKSPLDGSTRQR